MSGHRERRGRPWWSGDAQTSDHAIGRDAIAPDEHGPVPDLPGWAARNLADPSQDEALTPSAPAPAIRPPRRVAPPPAPSRLRGWGLAVVSLAAAAAAVPLAVTTLAQQDEPLPRVNTFPAASPGDLTSPDSGVEGRPRAPLAAPGPEHDVLPAPTGTPVAAPASAPVVLQPLAQTRPAVVPPPAPPVVTITRRVPVRVTTTTTTGPPPTGRSATQTGSSSSDGGSGRGTESGSSGSDGGSGSEGSGGSSGSSGGLLGGVVDTANGAVHTVTGLLN